MANLWNFILFQVNWFALVLAVGAGRPWWGVALALILLAVHLRWLARPGEWRLLALVGAAGWLWESLLHASGLLVHPFWSDALLLAPPWMAVFWINFAATLHHCLGWLKGRLWLSALLGAFGGPLAFWGGQQAGAILFSRDILALAVLAAAWAVLTPAVFALARATGRRHAGVIHD